MSSPEDLGLTYAAEPQTLKGLRDRALVLLGFAGAFRRSELVALDTAHLTQGPNGLTVLLASSKTDQEGQGQRIAIPRAKGSPYCPVQAVLDWLVAADISTGPVFRRMHRGDTLGHARLTGASIFKMAEQSRHKSLDVLREYVRGEARFEDHAGEGLLQGEPREP